MAINAVSSFDKILPVSKENGLNKSQNSDNIAQSFASYLNDAINKVNDLQIQSDNITNDFAAGKTDNIHQVMIAGEKAELALQFTMQVRNKILDAYNEIMRIQV